MDLKEHFNRRSIVSIALALQRAHPSFPADAFVREVMRPLPKMELKARVKWISSCLRPCLPASFPEACRVLVGALRSEKNPDGVTGFSAWPFTQFVEDHGLDDLPTSLATLRSITGNMSAEFAIRRFLLHHQDEVLQELQAWVKDPDVHVRRLASEGTRPLLPWGQRLPAFQRDPSLSMPLLRALRLDTELYVRKSVANHLNDISKNHPEFLVKELRRWQKEHPDHDGLRWIIRHASRTLLKAGHPGALSLHGFREPACREANFSASPRRVVLGQAVELNFSAVPEAAGRWLLDYAVHHVRANGRTGIKVFKWTVLQTEAGRMVSVRKEHAFRKITTRRYYSGRHVIVALLNGKEIARTQVSLKV